MRVLRGLLLLLPMLAWAGWRPVATVTPPVRDVEVLDAGLVLSVSPGGVNVWPVDGGAAVATLAGNYTGGGFYDSCVLGLAAISGSLSASPGCGGPVTVGTGGTRIGFKLLSSPPQGVAVIIAGTSDVLWSGPGVNGPWTLQTGDLPGSTEFRSLQTRQIGGIDYVAMNTGAGTNSVYVSVDGGATTPVTSTVGWIDAAPVPLNGAPALLGVAGPALVLLRDYRDANAQVETLSSPAGLAPRFVSSSGRASMATTASPTGEVLAPIPNPMRPLETWVVRSAPPGGLLGKVHCMEDRTCASWNDAGVIWLWTNDVAPTISIDVPTGSDAGQTVRAIADAGDGDGDPIFVSWDASVPLRSVAGVHDGTQIEFTAPGACDPFSIEAVVTDGYPGHERSVSMSVTPTTRGVIELSSGAPSVPAGSGALSFSAGIDGGCTTASLSWATSDGVMGTGPSFSWTPPVTECNADGGLVTITATASWATGSPATSSVSTQVLVEPWGAPETPRFDGGTQQSGTTVDWFPSGLEHQCSASAFFPGTELKWSFDAGGAQVMGLPDRLRVTAPPQVCEELQVTASAYRVVIGQDAGSDTGSIVVNIPSDAVPLDTSTPFSISVNGDAGVLFGVLSVDGGCLAERGVSATVTASQGGQIVDLAEFPHDGGEWSWALSLPGGCLGGTFDVVADLRVDGGSTGATAQGSFTLPFTPVIIGTQSVTRLDVACGAGARGTIALTPAPNACASADVQWRVSGPAVITPSGSGELFELQTEALDFSTVGQQLTIEWSADAGPGNGDSAAYTIDLGVQPFLEVDVKAMPPLRREEEPMTLELSLTNATGCAVDGVSVLLPFSGGAPIADSVSIEGVKTTARETDLGLVVDGVSVPAEGKATLQVSVRPRLLSSPSVEPVASLNGYVISTRAPVAAPATGCGCSTAELSMVLGALLLFVRRRRA